LPAGIVAGREMPETVNSELVVASALTVTLLPAAVSVPLLLSFDPTVTLPKLRLTGEALSPLEAVPVPFSMIPTRPCPLAFWAPNCPQTVPLEVGEKAILKVKLCPGVRVRGKDKPSTESSELLVTAFPIVTELFLPFVMATEELAELPTGTFPNTRLAGVAYSPRLDCPVPVTSRDAELPLIAISPDTDPIAPGLKAMLIAMLPPGESVTGNEGCLTV